MSSSYLPHTVVRVICLSLFIVGIVTHRNVMGDEVDSGLASVTGIVQLAVLEISCYINFKSTAKLFIELKVNEK